MPSESEKALLLFNKKVDRLWNGRYVQSLVKNGLGAHPLIGFPGQLEAIKKTWPDDDAIQAAVLTVRFFIQDNEKCSFRNLAAVYRDPRIPKKLRNDFATTRNRLNNFLDEYIIPSFENLTQRMLLGIAFYGDLAHAKLGMTERYAKLFEHELLATVAYPNFMRVLASVVKIAIYVSRLNKQVLERKYLESWQAHR